MGIEFFKKQSRYMKQCTAYRYKCLGGLVGPASDVRCVDPESGKVVQIIPRSKSRKGTAKKGKRKNKQDRKSGLQSEPSQRSAYLKIVWPLNSDRQRQ
jgi:hypothetical protein